MKKTVTLKLCEPIFSTYHYEGASSATIASNPSIRNWFLNQAIELSCEKRFLNGYTTPNLRTVQTSYHANEHFERWHFCMKHLKGSIHTVIRALLDDGFFVVFEGIDDYYIEGKTWYKKRHFSHDGLICGYDQNDKTYTLYAYDENWKYQAFRTPQKCFEKSRQAMFRKGNYGMLFAIKPLQKTVELDLKEICRRLHGHLNSNMGNYPPDGNGKAYGVIVHEYLAMYLDKLADGSIPYERMDWRIFRELWDHKRVMLERLQKVEEHLSWNHTSSEQYAPLVDVANHIRMLYASYHMKRKDALLPIIRNKLLYIGEQETAILTDFYFRLKEAMEK